MNMKKTMTTTLFGLCLLLAACSQDDMPNQENTDGALRPMTLTATLPEDMTTRTAADYDDLTAEYCYVQVLDENGNTIEGESKVQAMTKGSDGSYNLTLYLVPDKKYCFLFWADNVTSTAPEDLKAVKYTQDGTVIAFAAKKTDVSWSQLGVSASLGHVVTRISVKTTADATLDGSSSRLTVSVPRCYTKYNVYDGKPDASAIQENFAYDGFSGTFEGGEHVGHFYVLGDGTQQNLTITYEGTAGRNSTGLSNVPLLPNYHITLQGDITNIGLADVTITATVTTDWGTTGVEDIIGYTFDGSTYTVYNANGLQTWAEAAQSDLSTNCTLADNIDLTGIDWTPIGTSFYNSYTGTFDGNGKTITGLTVTGSDEYAGLFGYIGSGGTVKNVVLEDVQITSDNSSGRVGGVAGNSYGNIENCSVSGSVSVSGSSSDVGGVVGYQSVGSITGCSSSATVKGTQRAGGIAGVTNSGASLTGCYATGNVTLENSGSDTYYFAGGVVGENGASSIQACYATGSVTGSGSGTIYAGGVTGANDGGTLTACYHANGTVSATNGTTGGVAGQNYSVTASLPATITACYWGSNSQTQGIGYNQAGTGETKLVDGGTVTWSIAIILMNEALQEAGSEWRYDLVEGLPVLVKE